MSRAIPSAQVRKSTPAGGPRKTNVLGGKKTQKLGAKKVTAGADLDFEAAEKKAKEEAERIEKLGYDPDAEDAEAAEAKKEATVPMKKTTTADIVSPTPLSPGKSSGAPGHQRNSSEVERLGMGVARLGFGQVGTKPGAARAAPKKMGFGAAGNAKPATEGKLSPLLHPHFIITVSKVTSLTSDLEQDDDSRYARSKFGTQKGISSDEFFGKGAFDPSAQTEAKTRLQGFEGASSISSNAYFGRPEEDDIGAGGAAGEYGDLETAAKDFVRKFGITAGDDLENLSNLVGVGGRRLQGMYSLYLFLRIDVLLFYSRLLIAGKITDVSLIIFSDY